MYGASGPSNLTVGDTLQVLTAYLYGTDTVNISVQNSIDKLFELGQSLKNSYAQGTIGCDKTFGTYHSDNATDLEETVKQSIHFYPNPTENTIHVRGLQPSSTIRICDLNGMVVFESLNDAESAVIDMSHLANAIYILTVSDSNGIRTSRVVKQ